MNSSRHDDSNDIQRAKDLVSAASHELKTPLVLIRGLADALIHNAYDSPSKQREVIERIEFSSAAALALVDDILTIARLEADQAQLPLETINPQTILYDVAEQLDPIAKSYDQEIRIKRYRGSAISAHRRSLERVVYNLLTNAIKYSPEGSATVLSSSKFDAHNVRISVNDSGVGVSDADLQKIFTKFGTAAQPVSKYSGSTGLGLHIVKSLTEAMGGQFGLIQKQKGSNFYVLLPSARQLSMFGHSRA